jgi:hypothetical protein
MQESDLYHEETVKLVSRWSRRTNVLGDDAEK